MSCIRHCLQRWSPARGTGRCASCSDVHLNCFSLSAFCMKDVVRDTTSGWEMSCRTSSPRPREGPKTSSRILWRRWHSVRTWRIVSALRLHRQRASSLTPILYRKWLSPILPVRNWVRIELWTLLSPLCLRRAILSGCPACQKRSRPWASTCHCRSHKSRVLRRVTGRTAAARVRAPGAASLRLAAALASSSACSLPGTRKIRNHYTIVPAPLGIEPNTIKYQLQHDHYQ